jgi:hypothetical protein
VVHAKASPAARAMILIGAGMMVYAYRRGEPSGNFAPAAA